MTLLIREAEVRELLTMPLALEAVEDSLRKQAAGQFLVHERHRLKLPGNAFLHYMAAGDVAGGYIGMKLYTSVAGSLTFLVPLYSAASGKLVALIEAGALGQIRTGAASGVATKYLARKDARTAAIIGTGYQAWSQVVAVAAVRPIERIRAFGRDPERRAAFCRRISEQLHIEVAPASSAEEAVRGADIVITATTAMKTVLEGAWLSPGVHINAIGANFPQKRELDDAAVARAALICTDSIEQAKMESGDLIQAFATDASRWNAVRELADIIAGKTPGRASAEQITLFKSNGIASWDVAAAERVFELASSRGIGQKLSMWEA